MVRSERGTEVRICHGHLDAGLILTCDNHRRAGHRCELD